MLKINFKQKTKLNFIYISILSILQNVKCLVDLCAFYATAGLHWSPRLYSLQYTGYIVPRALVSFIKSSLLVFKLSSAGSKERPNQCWIYIVKFWMRAPCQFNFLHFMQFWANFGRKWVGASLRNSGSAAANA